MAKEAYWIKKGGERERVQAENCTEADKGKDYECCGKVRGEPCKTKMYLSTPQKNRNYFTATEKKRHILRCKYGEHSKYARIEYTDPTGANTSLAELLTLFRRNKQRTTGGGNRQPGPGSDGGPSSNVNPETDVKPIRRVAGNPKKLEHLVLLLLTLCEDDVYANMRVKEFFLDDRSIRAYREREIPEGQIAIPICGKTKKGTEYKTEPSDFVLVDGFYYDQREYARRLFFVVKADEQAVAKICAAHPNQKIAVFATWYHHPTEKNVYISGPVNKNCIAIFDREEFDSEP